MTPLDQKALKLALHTRFLYADITLVILYIAIGI